jgi:hypothetical protein
MELQLLVDLGLHVRGTAAQIPEGLAITHQPSASSASTARA